MKIQHFFFFLLLISSISLSNTYAQTLKVSITGKVTDDFTGELITGATVTFKDSVKDIAGLTDKDGRFKVDNIPVGRRVVKVTKNGYQEYHLADLEVKTGKILFLEIKLSQNVSLADSVVIVANNRSRQLNGLSTRTFTMEEVRRYAATYFDPARLVTSYPGVTAPDDGSNYLSVRGNSPNGLIWRLEGVEIVNPNHLSNGGTPSDRPTRTGGSVNILSAQMMQNSSFLSSAYGAEYGNSLGGVMDINLRKGSVTKDEYILQFGLLGIDIAAEGPVAAKGEISLLANYRYSSVGLLSQLGFSFGDELINFQDLSFNLDIPTKKLGTFRVFGIGGKSKNIFEAVRVANDSLWATQKDRSDITFNSRMGALGFSHQIVLGKKTFWRTAFVASGLESERIADYLQDTTTLVRVGEDNYTQSRLSFTSGVTHRFNAGIKLKAGIYANQIGYNLVSRVKAASDPNPIRTRGAAEGKAVLLQPYAQLSLSPMKNLEVDAGVHMMQLDLNGATSIEPRVRARYTLNEKQSVSLGYGLHSQMQPLSLYFSPVDSSGLEPEFINRDLGFTKSHHAVLSYAHRFTDHLSLKVEPYFQYLFNVPISTQANSTFSALNLFEDNFIEEQLVNDGTGINYGVEVSAERTLDRGYYFLASATYYESNYLAADGVERPTRYNGQYTGALTAGKEFYFNKEDKSRVLGIHARFIYQGGYYTTPIDTVASRIAETTVFANDLAFTEKLPDYYRLDLRIMYTSQKKEANRILSLDLQNVTGQENIAYRFFDPQANEVITKYQLGLIPILTYRVEF